MRQWKIPAWMLLPLDPPLPAAEGGELPSVPSLWERARMMFDRVLKHIGSTTSLSQRGRIGRRERQDLLGWLEPVERLVRGCLIVKAVNHLLMTIDGRRLMRDTPKMPMPDWPKPPESKSDGYVETIPHPGWTTIAQHRLALARQEQARQEKACATQEAATGSCPFRVVGWTFPEDDGEYAPPGKPLPCGISFLDEPALHRAPASSPAPAGSCAAKLARRIEALSRTLDNPDRTVRTLARHLARLPREALECLRESWARVQRHWKQGWNDCRHAAAHVRRAATILLYEPEREPEPG